MVSAALDLSLSATPESVGRLRHRVAAVAAEAGALDEVVDDIRLCVTEAVANAAVHAYGLVAGPVEVVVERNGDLLVIVVRDNGVGFTKLPLPGDAGRGLRIIDLLSRSYSISTVPGGGTEVRMTFRLDKSAAPGLAA